MTCDADLIVIQEPETLEKAVIILQSVGCDLKLYNYVAV